MFFSDIHIAAAIASKSHAGSGYQCRLCLPTQGEAACRRPQSFLRKDHGSVSTTEVVSTQDYGDGLSDVPGFGPKFACPVHSSALAIYVALYDVMCYISPPVSKSALRALSRISSWPIASACLVSAL